MSSNNLWANRKPATSPLQATPQSYDLFNSTSGIGADKKRYFACNDAEMYFATDDGKECFIDDLMQISFQMQQQAMPIFGYNSYVFDDIAVGARTVSGEFVINFTQKNYMYDVIEALSGLKQKDPKKNALWTNKFNMVIKYGSKSNKQDLGSTELFIKNVQLTGCSQMLGPTGIPVGEVYGFIAQDVTPPIKNDVVVPDYVTEIKKPDDIFSITSLTYSERHEGMLNIPYISVEYKAGKDSAGNPYDITKLFIMSKSGEYFAETVPIKTTGALMVKATDWTKRVIRSTNGTGATSLPVNIAATYKENSTTRTTEAIESTLAFGIIY
jgi:hypothetical protein